MKTLLARLLYPGILLFILSTVSVAGPAKIKIGFLVKMPEEDWFQKEWLFADQAGRELGFEVVKIGATDGERVLTGIDNCAAQGCQGFVICTPDIRLGPAIRFRARAQNLKVIAVDDQFIGADGKPMLDVHYLGISARKIGEAAGRAILDQYAKRGWKPEETGAIALMFNELQTARDRVDGAIYSLLQGGFPKAQIFDTPQKTTDTPGGMDAANITITQNPGIRHWFVFGINDESVVGGVRALEGRGFKAGDMIAVGIGGFSAAANEFKKKTESGFYATLLLQAKVHGYETSRMMFDWITKGKEPPLDTRTIGTLVTRENYRAVYTENALQDLLQ